MKTVSTKNPKFLALMGSYQDLSVGLFVGPNLLFYHYKEGQRLSSYLLVAIDQLFQESGWQLKDLDFIAVDCGPGSFNSLRAVLATINGVSMASGIPTIMGSGLIALANYARLTHAVARSGVYIALLNAYNNELYYRIELVLKDGTVILQEPFYASTTMVAQMVRDVIKQHVELGHDAMIWFVGNGCSLLMQEYPEFSSCGTIVSVDSQSLLRVLAESTLIAWQNGDARVEPLKPYLLKETNFKKAT